MLAMSNVDLSKGNENKCNSLSEFQPAQNQHAETIPWKLLHASATLPPNCLHHRVFEHPGKSDPPKHTTKQGRNPAFTLK
jgi:hypothetical protein